MLQLLLQAVVDGILLGGVYSTLALGLSIAYGVMGIINWATGETLVIGLFLSYLLVNSLGLDPYLTIPITFLVMGCWGFVLQRYCINHIIDHSGERAVPNALLFTTGYGYVASSLMEMMFGTLSRSTVTSYTGKSISLGDFIYLPVPKLIACVIAIIGTIILYFFIHRSEVGRAIRATSQDRKTAQLMGINAKLMFCLGLAVSFAMLGLTASLMIPYYPITPYVGVTFSFKALIIVVIGGRGNVLGALGGGLFVALVEKILGALVSDSFALIVVFILFIVVLLVRPNGLMNKRSTT